METKIKLYLIKKYLLEILLKKILYIQWRNNIYLCSRLERKKRLYVLTYSIQGFYSTIIFHFSYNLRDVELYGYLSIDLSSIYIILSMMYP